MREDTIIRRCRALQTVRFGSQVNLAQQNRFLQRVTPLCHMFAVKPTDLESLKDPKYVFSLQLKDHTPIQDKPIVYPPAVEQWLGKELNTMESTGRIKRVGPLEETPIVTALVLVP